MLFLKDTATTEIYTLSLRDALPIACIAAVERSAGRSTALPEPAGDVRLGALILRIGEQRARRAVLDQVAGARLAGQHEGGVIRDRKSTRLNSSHANISYALFCLKRK